jgi:hypothetical protein
VAVVVAEKAEQDLLVETAAEAVVQTTLDIQEAVVEEQVVLQLITTTTHQQHHLIVYLVLDNKAFQVLTVYTVEPLLIYVAEQELWALAVVVAEVTLTLAAQAKVLLEAAMVVEVVVLAHLIQAAVVVVLLTKVEVLVALVIALLLIGHKEKI